MRARLPLLLIALAAVAAAWWLWLQRGPSEAPREDGGDAAPASLPHTPEPKPPPPGTEIELALQRPPAAAYLQPGDDDDADVAYRQAVAALGRWETSYDWNLGRAARELAVQWSVLGDVLPGEALAFLLHANGAPETSAAVFRLSTSSTNAREIAQALRQALEAPPSGSGELMIGIGEAETPGHLYHRRIVVLQARRNYRVRTAARTAAPESQWKLAVELPENFTAPQVSVLYPGGELTEIEPRVNGRELTAEVATGSRAGLLQISIDGVDAGGPTKLLQLSVAVGDPPLRFRYRVPALEPRWEEIGEAETHAFSLLNRDRIAHGLQPLEWDPVLALVARAHSEEMSARDFFGHRSEKTGLLSDRLGRAHYRAVAHAENLARNRSLGEAEASLLASVGHRKNLLFPTFTRAGIGLARTKRSGQEHWLVTQVFARPVVVVAPEQAAADVLEHLAAERKKRGAADLVHNPEIARVAQKWAAQAASGKTEKLAEQAATEARPAVRGRVAVTVQVIGELSRFAAPEPALDGEFKQVGVGAVQSNALDGHLGVVLILSE